jgi:hypothetical protein
MNATTNKATVSAREEMRRVYLEYRAQWRQEHKSSVAASNRKYREKMKAAKAQEVKDDGQNE